LLERLRQRRELGLRQGETAQNGDTFARTTFAVAMQGNH